MDDPTTIELDSVTPRSDLKAVEYLLKREMADQMVTIQYDRAKGDPAYNPSVEKYQRFARVLRAVIEARGREGYIKVRDLGFHSSDHHKLDDEFEGSRSLLDIVKSLHATGAKPVVV